MKDEMSGAFRALCRTGRLRRRRRWPAARWLLSQRLVTRLGTVTALVTRHSRARSLRVHEAIGPSGLMQREKGGGRSSPKTPKNDPCHPLAFQSEVFGVLTMFARRTLLQSKSECLGGVASQAAVAIKNPRLFEVSQRSSRLAAENTYLKDELRADQPSGIL